MHVYQHSEDISFLKPTYYKILCMVRNIVDHWDLLQTTC